MVPTFFLMNDIISRAKTSLAQIEKAADSGSKSDFGRNGSVVLPDLIRLLVLLIIEFKFKFLKFILMMLIITSKYE